MCSAGSAFNRSRIGDAAGIERWADRLAPILDRLNAAPALHIYETFPSRTGPYAD